MVHLGAISFNAQHIPQTWLRPLPHLQLLPIPYRGPLRRQQLGGIQQRPPEAGGRRHGEDADQQELHGVLQLGVQSQDLPVGVLAAARVLDHMLGQPPLLVQGHLGGNALLRLLLVQPVPLHEAGELSGRVTGGGGGGVG